MKPGDMIRSVFFAACLAGLVSGAPAVPVRITGTFEALPVGRRLPRLRPLTIVFGKAKSLDELESLGEGAGTPARVADGLRRAVAELGDGQRPAR